MTQIARPMPKPTAQLAHYVEVLGADLAVEFLLQFGGAELYLPDDPKGQGALEKFVGTEKAKALAIHPSRAAQRRVPIANRWLAAMLQWKGYSTAHIARTLRVSDTTVRKWLKVPVPR